MTSSTIFCSQCGASNTLPATFCFACGQPLASSSSMTGLLATGSLLKQRYRLVRQIGQGALAQCMPLRTRN